MMKIPSFGGPAFFHHPSPQPHNVENHADVLAERKQLRKDLENKSYEKYSLADIVKASSDTMALKSGNERLEQKQREQEAKNTNYQ